jgi:hypothetical protein
MLCHSFSFGNISDFMCVFVFCNSSSSTAEQKASAEQPTHKFVKPTKQVQTFLDIAVWQRSVAWHETVGFILVLNEAVKGKSNSAERTVSPVW